MNAHTDNALLGGRVILRQPAQGYRVAIDPVLLAAAVRAEEGQSVLDAGCGSGAAMFCLGARVPGVALTGLELQPALAACARAGVQLNKCARARIIEGNLAAPPGEFTAAFDIVMTNPPYGADGTPPPDASLATAHMESSLDLTEWLRACLACLKLKGRLVLIHRADRLSEILSALRPACGDIRIFPIHPKANEPASRVIVDAGKGRRTPDTLLPGFVLHESDGRFSPAADAVLRAGAALPRC
ncbi:MAG: methyltransferase domain-containing protein [Rhodospirillaceae bacterium]|nr:methyltransferase domain-containing protein [Rhodospirillaceae bacterium]